MSLNHDNARSSDRARSALEHAAALLAYSALAVGMTWPLATNLATHVVKAKWHYDSMVNMMILGSRMHYALGIGALESVYDNYFCYPTPLSIANNETLFGLSLLYAPFYLATDDPLLAYNLLLLTCLALSGFFAYLLVRRMSGSGQAAFLCGVAYAFCPYIFFELGRVQLVAAQWVPLCILLAHDAMETGRWRSFVGLAFAYAMQFGSCLYYAFFLAIYFVVMGLWLAFEHRRWGRALLLRLAVCGALTGALVAPMAYPHLVARKDFPLTREEEKAAAYAGRLSDLWKVYPENKTLTFLHDDARGPTEPISFPGFVLLGFALVAIAGPAREAYRQARNPRERKLMLLGMLLCPLALLAGVGVGFLSRNFAVGVPVFLAGLWLWRSIRPGPLLPPLRAAYLLFIMLVLALFVGPLPALIDNEYAVGLYHYLYQHVPGFDGIRYVSRFAILMMASLIVLGGLGAKAILDSVKDRRRRWIAFGVLLALMLLELRNAPVTLAYLPNKSNLPASYRWLAEHTGPEPIAILPAYPKGYYGARNDYIALFHKRRSINGKSSWMPPVTHAYIREASRFPRGTMLDMIRTLDAKYLLLHLEEYNRARARRIEKWLSRRTDQLQLVFKSGTHRIYEMLPSDDPLDELQETPPLPSGVERIDLTKVRASAVRLPEEARYAIDGNPDTKWATHRNMLTGDWFELDLGRTRRLAAIDMRDFYEAFDAPVSYRLLVGGKEGNLREVQRRKRPVIYRDQVFRPRNFVYRIVLDEPVEARRVRIELIDTVSRRWWSIHEMVLWAK